MIPSSEQPVVLVTATEYREGQQPRRRDYFFRGGIRHWRVEEVSWSQENPPSVLCSFVVGDQGYSDVHIRNTDTGITTEVKPLADIRRTGARVPPAEKADMLLCDGPNPLFNYFNAMHLLAVSPGEERMVAVHVYDPSDDKLREEQYVYLFDGTNITVHKGHGRGITMLELDERYALRRVISDDCEIVVSRYSALFLN